MAKHSLMFRHAFPLTSNDGKIAVVIHDARLVLVNIAGKYATEIRFRHLLDQRWAKLGGPLGKDVKVKYLQLQMEFECPTTAMPRELLALLNQFRINQLDEVVRRERERMSKEAKEQAARILEEAKARPDPKDAVLDMPGSAHMLDATKVPTGKMLITSELEFAKNMGAAAPLALTNEPEEPK